jgi:hypothetical protein
MSRKASPSGLPGRKSARSEKRQAVGPDSARCDRQCVPVELQEVVGGGDQAPFHNAAARPLRLKRPILRFALICANTGSTIGIRFE